jgi:hypothetical protein
MGPAGLKIAAGRAVWMVENLQATEARRATLSIDRVWMVVFDPIRA